MFSIDFHDEPYACPHLAQDAPRKCSYPLLEIGPIEGLDLGHINHTGFRQMGFSSTQADVSRQGRIA